MPSDVLGKVLLFCLLLTVNSHTIPITKHQSSIKQASGCTAVGANNQTILGFGNCGNNIYYININIGTPSQSLGVQFDTGSDTLWIPTQLDQTATAFFNTSQSSTFTNTSNPGGVQYVDGSGVSGTYGTDVFTVQNSLINIVTTYLWVTSQSGMHYPTDIQGLVGMGYTNTPNFLDVANQNGQIGTAAFALEILDETQQSVIHYNQIPQSISNSTIFVPVQGTFYWQVSVLEVTVGGIDMTGQAADNAVVDSGTSYFFLNPSLYNAVIEHFFVQRCISVQGVPHCTCDTENWPTFAFTFQGVQVFIDPLQYQQTISSGVCTILFGSIGGISEILLGDIFFRKYIVTFDKQNSQIGFSSSSLIPVPVMSWNIQEILGWALVVLVGMVAIVGLVASCCIQQGRSQMPGGVYYPQLQLANTGRLRARLY